MVLGLVQAALEGRTGWCETSPSLTMHGEAGCPQPAAGLVCIHWRLAPWRRLGMGGCTSDERGRGA